MKKYTLFAFPDGQHREVLKEDSKSVAVRKYNAMVKSGKYISVTLHRENYSNSFAIMHWESDDKEKIMLGE